MDEENKESRKDKAKYVIRPYFKVLNHKSL